MSSITEHATFARRVTDFVYSNFSCSMSLHLLSTLIEFNFTLDDGSAESDELMHITDLNADYRQYLSDFIIKYVRQESRLNSRFICLRAVAFYALLLNGNNARLMSRTGKMTWPVW